MISIAIVEDDKTAHKAIKDYLESYADDNSYSYVISDYYTGQELLTHYRANYDVIFLDIQMPELDGLSAAAEIRKNDKDVIIVFITSLAQYALQGYKVQAYDYIVKPFTFKTLSVTLDRIMQIVENRPEKKTIMIQTEKKMIKIPVTDITYIEVSKHVFICHTLHEKYPFKATSMKALEKEFAPYHFSRCNNCYLINLIHITSVYKDSVIVGKECLAISRPRKKQFMAELYAYVESN